MSVKDDTSQFTYTTRHRARHPVHFPLVAGLAAGPVAVTHTADIQHRPRSSYVVTANVLGVKQNKHVQSIPALFRR